MMVALPLSLPSSRSLFSKDRRKAFRSGKEWAFWKAMSWVFQEAITLGKKSATTRDAVRSGWPPFLPPHLLLPPRACKNRSSRSNFIPIESPLFQHLQMTLRGSSVNCVPLSNKSLPTSRPLRSYTCPYLAIKFPGPWRNSSDF